MNTFLWKKGINIWSYDVVLIANRDLTRVLQKVLSLGLDYFSATFYQTYFLFQTFKVFHLY